MPCPFCGRSDTITVYGPYGPHKIMPYLISCNTTDGGCGYYTETADRYPKAWSGKPITIKRVIGGKRK